MLLLNKAVWKFTGGAKKLATPVATPANQIHRINLNESICALAFGQAHPPDKVEIGFGITGGIELARWNGIKLTNNKLAVPKQWRMWKQLQACSIIMIASIALEAEHVNPVITAVVWEHRYLTRARRLSIEGKYLGDN